MSDKKIEIPLLLRFFWKKGLTITFTTREICDVQGKDVISERTPRRWLERFNHKDTDLVDKYHSERSSIMNDEALRSAVEVDSLSSPCKLSVTLCPPKDTMN